MKALDQVNMEIKKGEFIAIIGHNGSGKSTLAKHFNALLFPEEGMVEIHDLSTGDPVNLRKIRQAVGMVFQNPDNQIIGATVEEDVAFGLENMQVPQPQMRSRIEQSLSAVGMERKKSASPGNLSGGQKQKVAIAGAVAVSPDCLVLDEATAMLDPKARKEVIRIARELNKERNMTIILITHFMDEVTAADKIFVMDHGTVVKSGTPEEIFADPDWLKRHHLEILPVTRLSMYLQEKGCALSLPVMEIDDLVEQIAQMYRGEAAC